MADEAAAWAALKEAQQFASEGEPVNAVASCDRALAALGGDPAPAVHAVATLIRATAHLDREPDLAALRSISGPLMAHGQWEAASTAHSLIAAAAVKSGDLAEARARYASAIGCSEAAGARWTASAQLRSLALAEIRLGDPGRALEHLSHALKKLEGVPLLNARRVEAECLDALGDAYAARGDRALAVESWRDAMAREERLERSRVAARIRGKIEARGN